MTMYEQVLIHKIEEYPVYVIDCIEDSPDFIEEDGIQVTLQAVKKWRRARKLWEETQAEMRTAFAEQEKKRLARPYGF